MKVVKSASFRAERPWGAQDLSLIDRTSVRLHWTDQPYKWHQNDGLEVFAVLDGTVLMHHRINGIEEVVRLSAGDIAVVAEGDEHYAEPLGEARILVVERTGSV